MVSLLFSEICFAPASWVKSALDHYTANDCFALGEAAELMPYKQPRAYQVDTRTGCPLAPWPVRCILGGQIDGKSNMKHFASIVLLGLIPGMVFGTFELRDPAAEVYEEQQMPSDHQVEQTLEKHTLCTINTETNECSCIDTESGREISMAHEKCLECAAPIPHTLEQQ